MIKHLSAPLMAAAALFATGAQAACDISFGDTFTGYGCTDLGTPGGLPSPLGGITFLDSDTLLIGGAANGGGGEIRQIDVIRDAGNHIVGYAGASTAFATAPNIDGGLALGPGGVLFATTYPDNRLLQYKLGSTTPDKIIDLGSIGITSSTGTLAFVPAGFGGAGSLKIASYSGGGFYDVTFAADGNGTYDLLAATLTAQPNRGPEGIVYVDGANNGFGVDGLLISEYGTGTVGAYDIDANGDPIVSTRRDFVTGLSRVEGAVIDPLTGDFLFSTFGGGDRVLVIGGFAAPPTPAVPEPATWAMLILGFGMTGLTLRRRGARPAVAR